MGLITIIAKPSKFTIALRQYNAISSDCRNKLMTWGNTKRKLNTQIILFWQSIAQVS